MKKYQASLLWKYEHTPASCDSLDKVYRNYSTTKAFTFEAIKEEMRMKYGYGMRVTSHNCMFYSCAYKYDTIDDKTGEVVTRLVYHTPSNRYEFAI